MATLTWFEVIAGIGFTALCFMLKRYIDNSDANNKEQWKKIDSHELRITTVETEHNMLKGTCRHFHRRAEDED
jgi:hypothetical protein